MSKWKTRPFLYCHYVRRDYSYVDVAKRLLCDEYCRQRVVYTCMYYTGPRIGTRSTSYEYSSQYGTVRVG